MSMRRKKFRMSYCDLVELSCRECELKFIQNFEVTKKPSAWKVALHVLHRRLLLVPVAPTVIFTRVTLAIRPNAKFPERILKSEKDTLLGFISSLVVYYIVPNSTTKNKYATPANWSTTNPEPFLAQSLANSFPLRSPDP